MKIMITIAALLSTSAVAEPIGYSIHAHALSYHTDRDLISGVRDAGNGQVNVGIGFRIDNYLGSAFDYEAGLYMNSYDRLTAYSVFDLTNDAGFGVYAGIGSGYNEPHTFQDGILAGQTVLAGGVYQGDRFTVRVTPSYNSRTETFGAVAALSVKIGG